MIEIKWHITGINTFVASQITNWIQTSTNTDKRSRSSQTANRINCPSTKRDTKLCMNGMRTTERKEGIITDTKYWTINRRSKAGQSVTQTAPIIVHVATAPVY